MDSPMANEEVMQIDRCTKEEVHTITKEFDADCLKIYYGKLFPYFDVFKWMSYGHDGKHPGCDPSFFGRREFSFTLNNDIYTRFRSFNTANEVENAIKRECPFKIDIGSVYSVEPSKRHAYPQGAFTPQERELIFDIDISDYDDVRYCCTGADVCLECWPLMTVAIKVIDSALRDGFGFNHILWVFSGRRGIHCWVCDSRARRLTNDQRASIADFFHVYKGGENNLKKVSLSGPVLHPFLSSTYDKVLKGYFEGRLLSSQKLFETEERFQKILELIPDESIASEFIGRWQGNRRSSTLTEDINITRWKQLKDLLQSGKLKLNTRNATIIFDGPTVLLWAHEYEYCGGLRSHPIHRTARMQGLRRCIEEIIFAYTYPRLDMEVTKHMNHLLKAPFCVHPKTGRVCVPIDPVHCDEFDPTTVPTLSELLEELNKAGIRTDSDNDWERTSLGKYIMFFRESFLQPLLRSCKEELEASYNKKLQQQSKNSFSF